jgi:hypothetical protein
MNMDNNKQNSTEKKLHFIKKRSMFNIYKEYNNIDDK